MVDRTGQLRAGSTRRDCFPSLVRSATITLGNVMAVGEFFTYE